MLDPDFGWHIQIGQLIVKSGFPKTDPYSYTMPSFPWVDHGWLTDVIIGQVYAKTGMVGLAAIFATIIIGVYQISIPKNWRRWSLVGVILATTVLLNRAGVRPQVEDWLFLAIIVRWLTEENWWQKWKWLLPVFFMMWANLHGGWSVGLGVALWLLGWKWWKNKRVEIKELIIWGLAVVATFINPFGWRLWHEIWLTASDTGLKWEIAEWQPFFMNLEFGLLFMAVMVIFFGWNLRKYLWEGRWLLVPVMLLLGLSSQRHAALFVVVAMPALAMLFGKLYAQVASDEIAKKRTVWFFNILIVISGIIGVWTIGWGGWLLAKSSVEETYPVKAVEYLAKNSIKGNVFSDYGWGGYLIWKLPNKKVFIDGRMPSWRWGVWPETGTAPIGESKWTFKDYIKVVGDGDYEELFSKYNVNTVLWHPKKEISKLGSIGIWLQEKFFKKKPKKSFSDKLQEGWIKVYEDKTTVVYVRPETVNQPSTN